MQRVEAKMIPLMAMFMQGGNGAALDVIGKQFGMSREDVERAAQALMPAFSEGLKRSVSDPAGFMRFMAAMASANYADYFADPLKAATKDGRQDGEAILSQIFGSKEVSRAIAAQAAQATGYSQAMLKQMLPMMAPVLMGGIFNQMAGDGQNRASAAMNPLGRILEEMMGSGNMPRGGGASANPWGQILEEMMRGGGGQMPGGGGRGGQMPRGAGDPWGQILEEMMRGGQGGGARPTPQDNPFGRMLEEMLGGRQGSDNSRPQGQGSDSGSDRLGEIFNDMLRGKRDEPDMRTEPQQAPPPEPKESRETPPRWQPSEDGTPRPETRGGLEDLFGKMFESGTSAQRDYQRGIEQIFNQLLGGKQKQ
jgi:hypothetical protein